MTIDHEFLEQSLNGTYENIERTVCVVYAEPSFFQVNETRFQRNLTDQIISYSLGGKLQDDTGGSLGGSDAEFKPIELSNLPIRDPDNDLVTIENSYPFLFNFSRNSSNDPPGMEILDYYFPRDECVFWDMDTFRWNDEGFYQNIVSIEHITFKRFSF